MACKNLECPSCRPSWAAQLNADEAYFICASLQLMTEKMMAQRVEGVKTGDNLFGLSREEGVKLYDRFVSMMRTAKVVATAMISDEGITDATTTEMAARLVVHFGEFMKAETWVPEHLCSEILDRGSDAVGAEMEEKGKGFNKVH